MRTTRPSESDSSHYTEGLHDRLLPRTAPQTLLEEDSVQPKEPRSLRFQRVYGSFFGGCGFGILFTLGISFLLFFYGAISLPENDGDIVMPECYGCVGMKPLCGAYTAVTDKVELSVEMEATTTCKYNPDGTEDTVLTIQKDPLNMFTACNCVGTKGVAVAPLNCSLTWQMDDCTAQFYTSNGVDPDSIVSIYDPLKDEIYTQSLVLIGKQKIKVSSTFYRDYDQDPISCSGSGSDMNENENENEVW
jgi:hypothetical protein